MGGHSLHPLLPGLKARVSALCQFGELISLLTIAGATSADFKGTDCMLGWRPGHCRSILSGRPMVQKKQLEGYQL